VGDLDAAEHESPSGREGMDVVALADSESRHGGRR
jgi:hypothetical protein